MVVKELLRLVETPADRLGDKLGGGLWLRRRPGDVPGASAERRRIREGRRPGAGRGRRRVPGVHGVAAGRPGREAFAAVGHVRFRGRPDELLCIV